GTPTKPAAGRSSTSMSPPASPPHSSWKDPPRDRSTSNRFEFRITGHFCMTKIINYDGILIVGFGGAERREDVLPFLENVLRGRDVPRARMLEVAEHYYHFEGISPINAQVRDLIAALRPALDREGVRLPIYWGNRNWHPLLP